MTKEREVNPTDGLMPTRLFILDGPTMLPSVSVPSDANARPIEIPTPLPDELPLGSIFG
jgi:hypothetical protein